MLLSALLLPLFLLLHFEVRAGHAAPVDEFHLTDGQHEVPTTLRVQRAASSLLEFDEKPERKARKRQTTTTESPDPHANRTMAELDDGWKVDEYSIDVDDYGCPLNLNYQCNLHNKRFMCTCHQSNVYEKMEYRSCDEVLRVFNPQAYILRFRVRLPDDLRLINVFDEFFADLIESKASIDKQYLFIVRKECVKGKLDVLVAFMRPGFEHENGVVEGETLQVVHPNIFLKNPFFMRNRYVRIYNVSSAETLTPIIVPPKPVFPRRTRPPVVIPLYEQPEVVLIGKVVGILLVILLLANFIPCIASYAHKKFVPLPPTVPKVHLAA